MVPLTRKKESKPQSVHDKRITTTAADDRVEIQTEKRTHEYRDLIWNHIEDHTTPPPSPQLRLHELN